MKVAFETLGCKLNQFETDAVASQFREHGFSIVPLEEDADVYVINTCTVTNKSDRKSRNIVSRVAAKNKKTIVVVTGCYAESARDELERQEGITYLVPNKNKNQIFHLVDAHLKGEIFTPEVHAPNLFDFPVHKKVFHTRALVKIQDGCDNFCSFCIIPHVRGRAKSRNFDSVIQDVRELITCGRKEIVLTGVNVGRYQDGERDFASLLKTLLDLAGDFRIRITSIEPEKLDDRFFDLLTHPKMCSHLHLCLQSGSPRVLLSMRREYSLDDYLNIVKKVRDRVPDFQITTDIIVGFPGETEEDFEKTVAVAHGVGFGHIHVFKFSKRQGTRAERMTDQVSEQAKSRRSEVLHQAAFDIRKKVLENHLGKRQRMLIEKIDKDGWAFGFGEAYLPLRLKTTPHLKWNEFYTVEPIALKRDGDEFFLEVRLL